MSQFNKTNSQLTELLNAVYTNKQDNKKIAKHKSQKQLKEKTGLFQRLALLYNNMQEAYNQVSKEAGLSCVGCNDNCCYSYFRHHTFVEWAYLWRGLQSLPKEQYQKIYERAKKYVIATHLAEANNTIPRLACPLLDEEQGRCSLYEYRLMICRLHGTRNIMQLANNHVNQQVNQQENSALSDDTKQSQELSSPELNNKQNFRVFSGCVRYVELTKNQKSPPSLDRTPFYQELAKLEFEFRAKKNLMNSKIDLTIAEMIISEIPKLKR